MSNKSSSLIHPRSLEKQKKTSSLSKLTITQNFFSTGVSYSDKYNSTLSTPKNKLKIKSNLSLLTKT